MQPDVMAIRSTLLALCLWAALVAPWALCLRHVEPYMDEIFHVPQAQKYCRGHFSEWDAKITTFPGLYLFAAAPSVVAPLLLPLPSSTCSVTSLRAVNVFFGGGCLVVLQRLLSRRMSGGKAAAQAFMLSLYPIHFFFTFLFYTDVGSLFWVLLTHHLATPVPGLAVPSPGRIALAALSGLVSVGFRQTNAVWVMFSFGTAALADLEASKRWGPLLSEAPLHRRLVAFARALLLERWRLLRRLGALLLPALLFAAFALWNGSVVVGDHTHHRAVPHWAQLLYLSAVTASLWGVVGPDAAVSPSTLRSCAACCLAGPGPAVAAAAAVAGAALLLHRYSLAHPFLLADNRHYTFYIWGRFLGKIPGLKEVLAPLYTYSAWLCRRRLAGAQSELWFLVWCVGAILTVVPAHLLEPRYWTTAVLLAHAHAPERTWASLLSVAAACLLVDVATLAVFVGRPFAWSDGSTARFMW